MLNVLRAGCMMNGSRYTLEGEMTDEITTCEPKPSADGFVADVLALASHYGFRLHELEFYTPNGMQVLWKSYWVDDNAHIERAAE